jgi:cyclopropane fatty-acyl-phospholipid synthase-like methyltransferase
MSEKRASFAPDYFRGLYAKDPDPWRFATSSYERDKYAATIAALGDRPIAKAFEVGCSIGILTRQLAARCGTLLAVDVAEEALIQARENCAALANVELRKMIIPFEWPEKHGTFDLILLSEVLYFLSPEDIRRTAIRTLQSTASGGIVLLVNWLGATDYPCGGDEAVEIYRAACAESMSSKLYRREAEYRIDLLERAE